MRGILCFLLAFSIVLAQNMEETSNCVPSGLCTSCISNSLSDENCAKTGWIQENKCVRKTAEGEEESFIVMLSCLPEEKQAVRVVSHFEALVLFLCLTVISTVIMLIRRRIFFHKRSFRSTYSV
ncbi:hypothetical protein WA556_006587 [Blastocystis sp. ATCC 50177/Nand II]